MQYTVVILEEWNFSHPYCPACDMLVTWAALNLRHPAMDLYVWKAERKIRRISEEEGRVGTVTSFWDYDRPFETVSSFK